MKNLFYLCLFVCFVSLSSCLSSFDSNVSGNDSFCDSCNEHSAMMYEQFYYSNDSSYLDTSLLIINKALQKCPKSDILFLLYMRKLSLLSQKREFDQMLLCLDSIGLNEKMPQYPYLQTVYRNRILAMQYHEDGDVFSQDSCLNRVVIELGTYLEGHKNLIDSLLCNENKASIENSYIDFPIKQYFYYLTMLKGKQETDSILNSLKQTEAYNQDYLEILGSVYDDDFMVFSGI